MTTNANTTTFWQKMARLFAPSDEVIETAEPVIEAELAQLAPAERQRRIEQRRRYERFAQRQARVEAELLETQRAVNQ